MKTLCRLVALLLTCSLYVQAQESRGSTVSIRTFKRLERRVIMLDSTVKTLKEKSGNGMATNMPTSPKGPILDRKKSTRNRIVVSRNGRVAWNTWYASRNAHVLGKTGYSRGRHSWTFRVAGLVLRNGLGAGVTTLPLSPANYDIGWSPTTVYAWFSNQFTGGRARSQTRGSARMSRWQNGDTLTLTLDCDRSSLHLHLHNTGEKKTITGLKSSGKPFYLWFFLGQPGHRVVFI